jgi:DNA-binding XRE family transcriptional regulator
MDKRRKHIDPISERTLREEFFLKVSRGEMTLRDAVKQMRKISRLTQPEFAKHRGIAVGVLRKIEAGEGNPQVDTLNKIGEIFGLEVGFVLRKSGPTE